jgi:hypothetical protein
MQPAGLSGDRKVVSVRVVEDVVGSEITVTRRMGNSLIGSYGLCCAGCVGLQ